MFPHYLYNNQIYAAANNTVYVTADSGLTWNSLGSNNPESISSMTAYANTLLVAPTATTSVSIMILTVQPAGRFSLVTLILCRLVLVA